MYGVGIYKELNAELCSNIVYTIFVMCLCGSSCVAHSCLCYLYEELLLRSGDKDGEHDEM